MERTIKTKFYEFNQNNSGGHFDVDENVCHSVIIEAMDEKHAITLFEPMIENQSGSCYCCGDRSTEYSYESNLDEYKEKGYNVGKIYFESIEQYCQFMANAYGCTVPDVRIHFLDGTKKEILKCKTDS